MTKKVNPVLGGFDRSQYTTQRLWATAPDGVKVPISLVYKTQGFVQDGSARLLLDGCGWAVSTCACEQPQQVWQL